MSTISAMQSALAGMQAAGQQAQKAAEGVSSFAVTKNDSDLVQDIVDLKLAKHSLRANVSAMKTAQEMEEHLIDVMA